MLELLIITCYAEYALRKHWSAAEYLLSRAAVRRLVIPADIKYQFGTHQIGTHRLASTYKTSTVLYAMHEDSSGAKPCERGVGGYFQL